MRRAQRHEPVHQTRRVVRPAVVPVKKQKNREQHNRKFLVCRLYRQVSTVACACWPQSVVRGAQLSRGSERIQWNLTPSLVIMKATTTASTTLTTKPLNNNHKANTVVCCTPTWPLRGRSLISTLPRNAPPKSRARLPMVSPAGRAGPGGPCGAPPAVPKSKNKHPKTTRACFAASNICCAFCSPSCRHQGQRRFVLCSHPGFARKKTRPQSDVGFRNATIFLKH